MLHVEGPRGESAEMHAEFFPLSTQDKLFKGGKTGLIILAVTLASAFIPLLHFITVPTGLVTSGFFLFRGFAKTKMVKIDDFKCPVCQAQTKQSVNTLATSDVFYVNCPSCKVLLKAHLS